MPIGGCIVSGPILGSYNISPPATLVVVSVGFSLDGVPNRTWLQVHRRGVFPFPPRLFLALAFFARREVGIPTALVIFRRVVFFVLPRALELYARDSKRKTYMVEISAPWQNSISPRTPVNYILWTTIDGHVRSAYILPLGLQSRSGDKPLEI